MSSPLVPCRCRSGAPVDQNDHGTGPDGMIIRVPAGQACDLCGGSGRTTRARLRAASWVRGLVLLGLCLLGLAVAAVLLALLSGGGHAALLIAVVAGTVSLGLAGVLELFLARTAPQAPSGGR